MNAKESVGTWIFLVTYGLISVRRLGFLGLDRPALALAGAAAYVAAELLTPEEALAAVDGATLLLLFSAMGMGAFLALDGFFDALGSRLAALAKTPTRLVGLIVWGAGGLSALVTNDAVCVLGAPLVVHLVEKHRLPPLPFLLALATAANTGSVATLVGNPQNMLCGLLGKLHYRDFLMLMGPVAIAGLAINHGLLVWLFRRELATASLRGDEPGQTIPIRAWLTLGGILLTTLAYTLGANLPWTAACGLVVLMLLHRRDTRQLWPLIDWSILLFFAGLFIVVSGFVHTGVPQRFFSHYPLAALAEEPWGVAALAALFLLGSNLVSNVPFILLIREQIAALPNPELAWQLLAMASTFAGNLTLLGSVANVIVAEAGHRVGGFGFRQHLQIGLPLAISTTAVGTAWLVWISRT
jgi:Na+/H+ antiporter NhaD/arsenite permease-like protein